GSDQGHEDAAEAAPIEEVRSRPHVGARQERSARSSPHGQLVLEVELRARGALAVSKAAAIDTQGGDAGRGEAIDELIGRIPGVEGRLLADPGSAREDPNGGVRAG